MFLAVNGVFIGGIILYWASLVYYHSELEASRKAREATPPEMQEEDRIMMLLDSLKRDGFTTEVGTGTSKHVLQPTVASSNYH